MMRQLLVLVVLASLLVSHSLCSISSFKPTGHCEGKHNIYKYTVAQSQFEDENKETLKIECTVVVTCDSIGLYEGRKSKLYSMVVRDSKVSGDMVEKESSSTTDDTKTDIDDDKYDGVVEEPIKSIDDMMKGWFKFVQTDDGAIPAVFHHKSENSQAVNFKKTIAAAFQANFKGTKSKVEADSQSVHKSKYTYDTTAQDKENKVVKMHRSVNSSDVKDYATHVPGDTVGLDKEEDIEYVRGVLTHSKGVTTAKIMPVEKKEEEDGLEGDSLEAEMESRKKRDVRMSDYFDFSESEEGEEGLMNEQMNEVPSDNDGISQQDTSDPRIEGTDNDVDEGTMKDEEEQTYDSKTKLPEFDAVGTYSLDLVGQTRVLTRERRAAVGHLELPEAIENSLMAHIDHAGEDMEYMAKLRSQLEDIHQVLEAIHNDPTTSSKLERQVEELISLESIYGGLPEYTSVIDTIISYLQQLFGSGNEKDRIMRGTLYFMLSKDNSFKAQKVLIEALDRAVDREEERMIIIDIAFTENPQPPMITELENKIRNGSNSSQPLLLAYGALVVKASPQLQQRMTLFLLNRLEHVSTNTSTLVHHILSLGNTESPHITNCLVDYLSHPDESVQLSSIHALRYTTGEPEVQRALASLVQQYNVTHNILHSILHTLLFGLEHASNFYTKKPFDLQLTRSLFSSIMAHGNEELQQLLTTYLTQVDNEQSAHLLRLITSPNHSNEDSNTNGTRSKRGTYWASTYSVYDLVSPLSTRQSDMRNYPTHKSYIWGKKFGVDKGNVQIAAGGFIGVAGMNYKLFGRAKAVGHAFGQSKTALDIKLEVKKSGSYIGTEFYAEIAGKTLVNERKSDRSYGSVCKQYNKPLFNARKYTLFNFGIRVFIYVGSLRFYLAGYVKLNTDFKANFCNRGGVIVTAEAKLIPSISMELEAGATANILSVVRGGISVGAVFTYKMEPKLSTSICLSQTPIQMKNCVTINHGWDDNRIVVNTWYQSRSVKKCGRWKVPCGFTWGLRKRWDRLSRSWTIGRSSLKQLYNRCDNYRFTCGRSDSSIFKLHQPSSSVSPFRSVNFG